MYWRQLIVIGTFVFVAVMVQLTLLSRLGLPGATPDLVVVTVAGLALAMGPVQGAAAGFAAGILVDLAPPADTLLGVNALVYLAVGFVVGRAIDPRDRTLLMMVGMTALAVVAATIGVAALDTVLGSSRVVWDQMAGIVLSSALYALIMAPLVIVATAAVARRVTPEASVLTG